MQWEYLTDIVWANVNDEGTREFIAERWPDYQPKEHDVAAAMPRLNMWGRAGWELVHMQPVEGVGKRGDINFGSTMVKPSAAYFCVFKRPLLDSDVRTE